MNHYHFKTLNSTNLWAVDNLDAFDRDKITIVTADEQTGGIGQFGRKWLSPNKFNLYASFCFFLPKEERSPLLFTRQMAKCLQEVLISFGIESHLKWPNDLLVGQKKIAGILTQTVPFDREVGIVVGIGLNVNMPAKLLEKIDQPATSIYAETGKKHTINALIQSLKEPFNTTFSSHNPFWK